MRKFLLILILVLIAITSVQLWITKDRTTQKKEIELTAPQAELQIGGTFTLIDQMGKTVHDTDFNGRVMLVFFGFTHCPDECPATVLMFSKMMELLGDKADQVVPIFISVDPQRDTPEVMKNFLSNFDKRIIGLTGTPEQIKKVGEAYKIYYAKTDMSGEPVATDKKDAKTTDYAIDHSAYIYMMGKDGKYLRIYPYNITEQELVRAVGRYL